MQPFQENWSICMKRCSESQAFPESAEQLELMKQKLGLVVDQVGRSA